MTEPPFRVLVTDAERGSAVAIIRSLGRRGMHVIAASAVPDAAGFRSRYANDRLVYPTTATRAADAIEAIRTAALQRNVDLIIPVTDHVIVPLDAARKRFDGVAALALPGNAALATVRDKLATTDLAARLGLPTPRTALAATVEEALESASSIGWPVVLKPQASLAYDGGATKTLEVAYADNPSTLAKQMRRFEGLSHVLLQEYCVGEGHGVEVLAHEGRLLAAFQHRRLREVPITGGASSFRESVALDPILAEYTERIIDALRWTGLAMVEFKIGRRGRWFMEINGRVWGSLPLAVKSGMDFPARLAELYLEGPLAVNGADTSYRVGVRSRNLELEVVWIASVLRPRRRYDFIPAPKRRAGIAAAVRLLNPADGYDAFARDDLGPAWAEIRATVRFVRSRLQAARHGAIRASG